MGQFQVIFKDGYMAVFPAQDFDDAMTIAPNIRDSKPVEIYEKVYDADEGRKTPSD